MDRVYLDKNLSLVVELFEDGPRFSVCTLPVIKKPLYVISALATLAYSVTMFSALCT